MQNPQVPPARQVVEQSHQALDKPAEGLTISALGASKRREAL